MSEHTIQSLWIGKTLSNNERLCLHSFIHHGNEFHLYVYDEIPDIPEGVMVKDANAIIPASRIFRDNAYTYASFADWFRLKMLYELGGWWVDMDVVCLQPFKISDPYCISSEWNYKMTATEVNNTCLKCPPGAQYIGALLQMVEEKVHSGDPVKWGDVGVYLFRQKAEQYEELTKYCREPEAFCPLPYFDLSTLICPGNYHPASNTMAIHLWNEIWRRGNLDKNARYHPESVYEKLKEIYLPADKVLTPLLR